LGSSYYAEEKNEDEEERNTELSTRWLLEHFHYTPPLSLDSRQPVLAREGADPPPKFIIEQLIVKNAGFEDILRIMKRNLSDNET